MRVTGQARRPPAAHRFSAEFTFFVEKKPRFLVLRRRTLTVGAALLAAAAIFGAVNAPAAVRASAATRQLPIYCVERDQKVCSISFDAAWGDAEMRQ